MGDTKKSMMTWEEKKIQERLEVIKDDYIVLAGFATSGDKSAIQMNDIIEEMKRLVNERAVLLKISKNIRESRRVSLSPNMKNQSRRGSP